MATAKGMYLSCVGAGLEDVEWSHKSTLHGIHVTISIVFQGCSVDAMQKKNDLLKILMSNPNA